MAGEGQDKKNMPNAGSTTTTVPSTQVTIPGASTWGSTQQQQTPSVSGSTGPRVSPSLQNENILVEDGSDPFTYAIGVKGRRFLDNQGKVIRYQGYKFTGPGAPEGGREPLYFAGDEEKIASFAIEDIANLQRAMSSIGLLGDRYSPGVADSATRNAYKNLLEEANVYGEDVEAAVLRLAAAGASRSRGPLTQYRVSNESDVKAIVSRVAKQTLGRNLGEEDLTRIAAAYRNLEKQAGTSTSREVMAAPSPEVFAGEQIQEMLPEETSARQFGSYLEAIKERYQL